MNSNKNVLKGTFINSDTTHALAVEKEDERFKNLILVVLGAFVLCFAGLNNKFPLLTPDSGSYINAGFAREVPVDRPVLYGLFVAHASWGKSLWLVIYTQALMLSLLLFYYFRYFTKSPFFREFYLGCLFFVTFVMTGSIAVSTIGPDVFGSMAVLGTGLLLFAEKLRQRDFFIIACITAISCGMDILYMFSTGLLILFYVGRLLLSKRSVPQMPGSWKKLMTAGTLIIFSGFLVSSIHFSMGGAFGLAGDKDMVILPRLINNGLAKNYIVEQCAKNDSIICQQGNLLKFQISSQGRFYRSFMKPQVLQANQKIVQGAIAQPGFWTQFAVRSGTDFLYQLGNLKSDTYMSLSEETEKAVYTFYNHDMREYFLSKQKQGWLTLDILNTGQVIWCILFAILLLIIKKKGGNTTIPYLYFPVAFILSALLSGILYGENSGLQHAIAWLFSVSVFIHISRFNWTKRRNQKSREVGRSLPYPKPETVRI